jgi:hypothetical protein
MRGPASSSTATDHCSARSAAAVHCWNASMPANRRADAAASDAHTCMWYRLVQLPPPMRLQVTDAFPGLTRDLQRRRLESSHPTPTTSSFIVGVAADGSGTPVARAAGRCCGRCWPLRNSVEPASLGTLLFQLSCFNASAIRSCCGHEHAAACLRPQHGLTTPCLVSHKARRQLDTKSSDTYCNSLWSLVC